MLHYKRRLQTLQQITNNSGVSHGYELKNLKDEKADWCSSTEIVLDQLQKEFNIEVGKSKTQRSASGFMGISTITDYQELVVVPYIDLLTININERFSDKVVKLLVSTSIFDPAELPSTADSLASYGIEQIKELADFYSNYHGVKYTSPPVISREELISEWKVFRRALSKEKQIYLSSNRESKCPSLVDLFQSMESEKHIQGFSLIFYLVNILLALPIGTATVERSFSEMIKTRLRNRLADCNLSNLMKIAVEEPPLKNACFEEILDVFKRKNRRIGTLELNFHSIDLLSSFIF